MGKFSTHYIPENKLVNTDYIGVYQGEKIVGMIKPKPLKPPDLGNKLYSFGALSDVHVTIGDLALSRFIDGIKYLVDVEGVAFTCIAGDLTGSGTPEEFQEYIQATERAKENCEGTAIIHDTTGNHDVEQGNASFNYLQSYANGKEPYATRPLYYSFTHGNDLFIMFGMTGWPGKNGNTILFSSDSMEWLEETLEANRDKRCFLFEHCPYFVSQNGIVTEGIGAVVGLPPPTGGYLSRSSPFMLLLSKYPNVIWLHGHTHIPFYRQADFSGINYAEGLGFHIPSLAGGRRQKESGGWESTDSESWGIVVDVYEKHIVTRGLDFVNKKFDPVATYCLNTTI